MKQIIVYDFDKTLTTKDTLFAFFRHASDKNVFYPVKIIRYIFCMITAKLKILNNTQLKQIGVKLFLSKMNENDYIHHCKSFKHKIPFNQLYHSLQFQKGNEYYIVSASFADYIEPLFPDFAHVIGSTLKIQGKKIISLQQNCYGQTKKQLLQSQGIEKIDLFYTDSYSDYALASISDTIYIVDGNTLTLCENIEAFKNYFNIK